MTANGSSIISAHSIRQAENSSEAKLTESVPETETDHSQANDKDARSCGQAVKRRFFLFAETPIFKGNIDIFTEVQKIMKIFIYIP